MKPKIAVIGGGTAGLSFSSFIDTSKFEVTLFEQKNRLGSKLLVAGKGGFNLTHSEPLPLLIERYRPSSFLNEALLSFSNSDFRSFLKKVNIETFVGSSGRIFPVQSIKPIEVLNAIQKQILQNNVKLSTNSEWIDLKNEDNSITLQLKIDSRVCSQKFDYVVFAMGGKSWSITGSDGNWLQNIEQQLVKTTPFKSSNSAMKVSWPQSILESISGKPLKNISVSANNETVKGEIIITDFGLEGTPIYTLNNFIRNNDNQKVKSNISIDFKPGVSIHSLLKKIDSPIIKTWTNHIETKLKLSKTQMILLKQFTSKKEFLSPSFIVDKIKNFNIDIRGLAPVDEAISTVGGINIETLSQNFELKSVPNVFTIGEMIDWDAPTGGYLIQGCMSMGHYLAQYFNREV